MSLVRRSVRRLAAYAPGEQPAAGAFIKLNTNENPYPPSPRVAEALAGADAAALRLYPDPFSRRLRERIARLHGVSPQNVFAGNGADEVLALCTRAFVERGGSIGYFVPSYSLYPVLADIREVRKRPVELGAGFRWRMPRGYSCSLFFLTNPNAPTGMLYPRATVASFCRRFPGVVALDEAYVDFARGDCMDLARGLDNVLAVRTLSKAYSLAGLRVGYAVGSATLVGALFKLKDSYNIDALSQRLALAALSDVAHMRRNVARIRASRRRLSEALAGMGYTVYPSEANFVWAKPRGMPAAELFRRLRARKILVRHFDGPGTSGFVRVTVGTDREIRALVRAIEEEEAAHERQEGEGQAENA
jgi:histidinol-phosphate aminotransferase